MFIKEYSEIPLWADIYERRKKNGPIITCTDTNFMHKVVLPQKKK